MGRFEQIDGEGSEVPALLLGRDRSRYPENHDDRSYPKLDFGHSGGMAEGVSQASLKGLRGFWRFAPVAGHE